MHVIFGINAVAEALKAHGQAFEWVGVAKERNDLRLQKLIQECRKNSIAVRFLPRVELDRMAGSGSHQGVVAVTTSKQYSDLDDVIAAKRGEHSLIVVLDGVEDPHNLGAILRTRSEEHTSELQSQSNLVCRLLLEKKISTPDRTVILCPRLLRPCFLRGDSASGLLNAGPPAPRRRRPCAP